MSSKNDIGGEVQKRHSFLWAKWGQSPAAGAGSAKHLSSSSTDQQQHQQLSQLQKHPNHPRPRALHQDDDDEGISFRMVSTFPQSFSAALSAAAAASSPPLANKARSSGTRNAELKSPNAMDVIDSDRIQAMSSGTSSGSSGTSRSQSTASSSAAMWGSKHGGTIADTGPKQPPTYWFGNSRSSSATPSLLHLINYGDGEQGAGRAAAAAPLEGRPYVFGGKYPHRLGNQDPMFPHPPSSGDGGDGNPPYLGPGGGDDGGGNHDMPGGIGDVNGDLALLLPLLILLSSMLFFLLIFMILILILRRRARIILSDNSGPLDIGREEELEGHGGLDGIEARWLDGVEDAVARGYARAKEWISANPPASVATDITISQSVAIQEKGVSAWSFEPDYEDNPSVFVVGRTELTFLADGQGMAAEEGGGSCVMSNLPLPKVNEVYYWEVKIFTKPETTNVSIGLATKPFPSFRLPGWCKFSIGYFSQDGFKCHNYPFTSQSYGPAYVQGDVIGIGYRPRTGTVFFTRNGRRLEDAFVGLNRHNYFPCIGADGSAEMHVNLGQAAFVFIEANVKKWGLAPSTGTLPPPPAYGMEQGSILIESGGQGSSRSQVTDVEDNTAAAAVANAAIARRNALRAQNNHPLPPPRSPPPPHSALPTDVPQHNSSTSSSSTSSSRRQQRDRTRSRGRHSRNRPDTGASNASEDDTHGSSPHNPPTPHELDISLHSLRSSSSSAAFPQVLSELAAARAEGGASQLQHPPRQQGGGAGRRTSPAPPSYASLVHTGNGSGPGSQRLSLAGRRGSAARRGVHSHQRSVDAADLLDAAGSTSGAAIFQDLSLDPSSAAGRQQHQHQHLPPSQSSNGGILGGVGSRASGFANAVLGMLTDRGLLTPMSAENPTPRSPNAPSYSGGPSDSSTSSNNGAASQFPSGVGGTLGRQNTAASVGEQNSYFPTMTPAQQREQWDRDRALLAEQQAAARAASGPAGGGGGGRPGPSRSGSSVSLVLPAAGSESASGRREGEGEV